MSKKKQQQDEDVKFVKITNAKSKLINIVFDSGKGRLIGLDENGDLWMEKTFDQNSFRFNGWAPYHNTFGRD